VDDALGEAEGQRLDQQPPTEHDQCRHPWIAPRALAEERQQPKGEQADERERQQPRALVVER